jgi:hypothetical protein
MRHPKHFVLLAALGMLVLVGVASASRPHPSSSDVSAAFSATQTAMRTRTCTVNGDMFRVTNATWRGTSASAEPRLAGTLVVTTHAVANETTGDGWATGTWRTTNSTPANPRLRAKSNARLSAVIDNANHLDGLATGVVRHAGGHLLGNWSATIVGNELSGELGADAPIAPDNSAVLYLTARGCP